MFRSTTGAGLALASVGLALIASAPPAVADAAPVIHVGSDTRAKTQAECMRDANFAMRDVGLQVNLTTDINVGGVGEINGAGVQVLVTCLSQGSRTFIEVVGASLDSSAAEQGRNRVRTVTMGAPT